MKNINFDPFLVLHAKVNFMWILDVNIKDQRIKFLEGKIGEYSHDLELGKDFLNRKKRH